MIKNVYLSTCKAPIILVQFFSTDFQKILQYQTSQKPIKWALHCSMQTDTHDRANSRIAQFCKHT